MNLMVLYKATNCGLKVQFNKKTVVLTVSYLCLGESGEIWFQVEDDSLFGSRKSNSPEKQDDQHQVGEESCEIHHLK